jgi:hypothetical protein
MRRVKALSLLGLCAALSTAAVAGIPRGVSLSGDEQFADDATGITIARGNAEIAVGQGAIAGRADVIELRPGLNEILLKGRAGLTVGRRRYEGDTVSCTLDFVRCTAVEADQDLPALPTDAAATMPR